MSWIDDGVLPNKRLQLPPNSYFQSTRGMVLAADTAPCAGGQCCWVQLNRQSVRQRRVVDALNPASSQGPQRRIRPRAVLRGFLWDTGLTAVSGGLLAHYLLPEGLIASGDEEIDFLLASTYYNLLFLPIGLCYTAYGAYLAAVHSPGAESVNALAVGIASLLLGLLSFLVPSPAGHPPLWLSALGAVLLLPAAAIGGWIASENPRAAA